MRFRREKALLFAALIIILAAVLAILRFERAPSYAQAHYVKREYRISMRDGVKLFTQVYVPKDASRSYPILITRTPFGVDPYGENNYRRLLGPSPSFDRAGYIYVFQDDRGRNQSEGEYIEMRPHIDHPRPGETDESTDMYDTVEWLLKNVAGNNGNVGVWGISYPGFLTSASIIDSHPAIKAASPQAPVTDEFLGDDSYRGGTFLLSEEFLLYGSYFRPRPDGPEPPNYHPFDYGTKDGYGFFLQHGPALADLAAAIHNPYFDANSSHNTYDDYWKARDLAPHLHNIHCAVLNVGGWFDAEDLAGPFRTYHAIEQNNPSIPNTLVVGPWSHGEWVRGAGKSIGPLAFPFSTSDFFRDRIAFPFFEHFLKGAPAPDLPEAYVFETGTNSWKRYDAWPPKNAQTRTLYLHANRKLSFSPPAASEEPYDEYVSDPANPVPYVEHPSTELDSEYMYADQLFATKRPDVLTYTSDPLNRDITVVGPVAPRLRVSSSGTDSDFDVKLIDVYPDNVKPAGYQLLIRGEPMRAKFRDSWIDPKALVPGAITPLDFTMQDVDHTFRRGHRIMVQIQSSWFPLTDLNPQRFISTAAAKRSDFTKATERVYHAPQSPSSVVVSIVPQA